MGQAEVGGGQPARLPWAGPLAPVSLPLRPLRFIKSERSIILLNFCLSILASNVLILVGQSRVLSKAGAGHGHQGESGVKGLRAESVCR